MTSFCLCTCIIGFSACQKRHPPNPARCNKQLSIYFRVMFHHDAAPEQRHQQVFRPAEAEVCVF
jgi:hypothetical protein